MAQLFGYAFLILAFGGFLCLIFAHRQRPSLGKVYVFSAIVGVALIFSPRLEELDFFRLVRIKLREAETDANSIRDLRKEVEQTSAEVRRIEQEASQRLGSIEQVQGQSEEALLKLKAAVDFSTLLSRVKADDGEALKELLRIAEGSSNPFASLASQSLRGIKDEVVRTNMMVLTFAWKEGHSLKEIVFNKLRPFYLTTPPSHRLDLLRQIWDADHYSTLEKLDFLTEVVRTASSIYELERACQLINHEAHLKASFLEADQYLKWWQEKRADYL